MGYVRLEKVRFDELLNPPPHRRPLRLFLQSPFPHYHLFRRLDLDLQHGRWRYGKGPWKGTGDQ